MKKLALTIAIVLGLSMASFAQGGLFQRGAEPEGKADRDGFPSMPGHGETGDQNATTPLGTGIAIMTAFGAAYLVGKRRKED